MLTLNDGRAELWQWDTGRTLSVDADCSQVHFSNKVFGRSIDVDVVDGAAIIPDVLLQTDKDLSVWAFVGTAENGYTKISKTFKVNRRNKPADYVFTPTEQMTLQTIQRQIGDLADLTTEAKDTLVSAINEAAASGGGSSDAVLHTPQTLTDAQKKQARENIDAASSDFVINGTLNDEALTVDKTYAKIQEAVQAGKSAVLKVKVYGIDFVLPLIGENSSGYLFTTAATVFPTVTKQFTAMVGASGTAWNTEQVASYDSDGNLVQIPMDRDPEQAMEIATKQYVDNNATCGTDMGITGAAVGQIAKITAVDGSGKPTAWEAVEEKTLKWIKVHESTLTENTNTISVGTDESGKELQEYNPIGIALVVSTPADATQTDNNGQVWVYPQKNIGDNAIRIIGTIASWKTVERDAIWIWQGGSTALACNGNNNGASPAYKANNYAMNGVYCLVRGDGNHLPAGTRVEVSILCEV